MGVCWSEPPVATTAPVQTKPMNSPSAPPYAYAVKDPQQQTVYYQYAYPQQQQQQQQYYSYQYPPQQYPPQQYPPQQYPPQQYPPQQQTSAATAFVGGLLLGSIVEDMLDPC